MMTTKLPLLLASGTLALGAGLWFLSQGDTTGESLENETGAVTPAWENPSSSRQSIPSLTHAEDREVLESFHGNEPTITITEGTQFAEAEAARRALRAEKLAERREELKRMWQERAVRIADELNLGTGAETKIAQVFSDEQERLDDMQAAVETDRNSPDKRKELRDALNGIKEWRHERFVELFGDKVAKSISEFEDLAAVKAAGLNRGDTD